MAAEWGGRERALAMSALGLLAMFLMLARAAQLQVFQGGQYRLLSTQNRVRMIAIPSPRGRVLDRNGRVISESRPGYALVLFGTGNWRSAVRSAARLLGLDSLAAESTVRQQRAAYPRDPVKLLRDLSPLQVAVIEEHAEELPGLRIEYEALRHSNCGLHGSHLLGYVSEIGRRELEKRGEQGYRFGDMIGKSGLERQYESLLRGSDGCEYLEVDAHGRVQGGIPQMPELPPVPGVDIQLTVDWRLQDTLEGLFEPNLTGAAVALEPGTGRILALVSRPNFDPNLFAGGVSAAEWDRLSKDPRFPLWDRAIRSLYPPGSTFKLVTALAALSESLITPESRMRQACHGGIRIGNRYFKCWKGGGHGSLDLGQAIVQSCDVYFYQLGMMLGVDRLNKWADVLGLARPTGVDLPQEVKGLVPNTEWYEKRLGRGAVTAGIPANLAIGQGEVLATPLQMASLFAAVGKRGLAAKPHLVLLAVDARGKQMAAEQLDTFRLPIRREYLEAAVAALAAVVNQPGGTGGAARVEGVAVAGKTGTAQNPHGNDHSWFVGFAPAHDPVIAVAAIVENAGHGSAVAAPIVGKTIKTYLNLMATQDSVLAAAAVR
jgi:penicillin-binding protein 2